MRLTGKERSMQLLQRGSILLAMMPVLCCFSAALVFAQDAAPKILTVEADEWCPINCTPASGQEGIGIDIARKIFEPLGYKVNYVIVPWTQALTDARSGTIEAVVGANMQDDPSLLFPSSYLFNISDDFYVMNGSRWRYQGPYTLKDKHVGVIAGYGYGAVITQFIKENLSRSGAIQATSGKDALNQNMARLREGKIDVLIESKPVMDYNLQKKGETQIIWAGGVEQAPVYMAFSPKNPAGRTLQNQYDVGFKRLEASGEIARIYRNYGLKR